MKSDVVSSEVFFAWVLLDVIDLHVFRHSLNLPYVAGVLKCSRKLIREAFQYKKRGNFGSYPNRGSQVSVWKSSKLGGRVFGKQKSHKVRGYQRLKNIDSFSSYEDPKT